MKHCNMPGHTLMCVLPFRVQALLDSKAAVKPRAALQEGELLRGGGVGVGKVCVCGGGGAGGHQAYVFWHGGCRLVVYMHTTPSPHYW